MSESRAPHSIQQCAAGDLPVLHDSFLVRGGRVLDIDAHIDRLAASGGWPIARIRPEYEAVLRSATATAEWSFPLVTLRHGRLDHRLRRVDPSALRTTATLWTPEEPDPRRFPRRKGPDLAAQGVLRRRAVDHGADEALLVGEDGTLREGAFSSVVHWEGGRLVVSSCTERLPSVTEAAVVRAAVAAGTEVSRRACRPEEIRGADEVWILSSLHGIRVVTAWDGRPIGQAGIAAEYRRRLRAMERDVSTWLASVRHEALQDPGQAREG